VSSSLPSLPVAALPDVLGRPAGRPLVECLGTFQHPGCELRYILRNSSGTLLVFRPSLFVGQQALLQLHPDVDHWRRAYPGIGWRRMDAMRAIADLVRRCLAAGPYDLPKELQPPRKGQRTDLGR
jgi:hypothetical protein